MPINRRTNTNTQPQENKKQEQQPAIDHVIRVTRCKEIKDRPDCYRFQMEINDVTIYGCSYVTYTDRNGEQKSFVSFPQYKGSDGKYYNNCYCRLSEKDMVSVEGQIEDLMN